MSDIFRVSPLQETFERDDETHKLLNVELRDLARGFCGALFLALPLHYTMEMWERARVIPCWDMAVIMVIAYFLNVGFNLFNGFKPDLKRKAAWFDALEAMGIGCVASIITMLLIDQFSWGLPFEVGSKIVALQMVPTSFGASLAKSQLGSAGSGGEQDDKKSIEDYYSADFKKMVGATLGAVIFSFSVGATLEPIVIASSINPIQIIGLIVFSLFTSYLMVFIAGFSQRDQNEGGIMGTRWAETLITYAISLLVSAGLLYMFGYLTPATPIAMSLPWIVVLGYATSLGSSAGRLII